MAGVSLDAPASAAATAPVIVTRSEWGADESLRNAAPSYSPVKMAFVHHTASGNVYSRDDAPALVRGIYAYHTKSLHWNDIAYNFLVDRFGNVYEGRYGGVSRGVVGAHVYGFNTGSTGVSVMGTFTDEAPPAEAVAALQRLLAWKLAVHGLDPQGTARLTCGAGGQVRRRRHGRVPGHRRAPPGELHGVPGRGLLRAPPVHPRQRGEARRHRLVATLGASAPLISPNGDGVLDATVLDVGVSAPADWRVAVRAGGGQAVASWSGQGTSATITWNGASGGERVPDGVYTAELTATPSGGEPAVGERAGHRRHGRAPAERSLVHGHVQPQRRRAGRVRRGRVQPGRGLCGPRRHPRRATATWSAGSTAGGRERPARTRSRGTAASPPEAASWPRPTGSTASTSSAATRRATSPARASRSSVDRTVGFPAAVPVTFSPDGNGVRDTTALGFKLTRKATVTVRVLVGSDVVRTLSLGALARRARSARPGTGGPGRASTSPAPGPRSR